MPPLEHNEKILYIARKHWLLLASETILLCLLALIPGFLLAAPSALPSELLDRFKEMVLIRENLTLIIFFLWSLELLTLYVIFFMFWTDYYLDVWLVTNLRVIAIEQHGLFNRSISTFRLDMIQDAVVKVPGMLATLLHFGTVEVSTASDYFFTIKGVARPNVLKEKIMAEHHRTLVEKQEVRVRQT
jgi:hypothetical protein